MGQNDEIKFGVGKNIKPISRMDLPGGGQVMVDDGYCYVGHVEPPHGAIVVLSMLGTRGHKAFRSIRAHPYASFSQDTTLML